jgi:hypothetical protein
MIVGLSTGFRVSVLLTAGGASLSAFGDKVSFELSHRFYDEHLLLSTFDSPPHSSCSRSRRMLSCSVLFCAVLGLSAVYYGLVEPITDCEEWTGDSQFTARDWHAAAVVGSIAVVMTCTVFATFRNCKRQVTASDRVCIQ